jgi:hypothetical protein
MKAALLTLLFLLNTIAASAQQRRPEDYVRILVPAGAATGANGAQWTTTLWVRNDSAAPLDVFPMNNQHCPVSSGCFRGVRERPALGPHETAFSFGASNRAIATVGDASPAEYFFFVERGRLDDVTMQLHATDRSRTPDEITQLPLVPETAFFARARSIIGVTLTGTSRVSLRVFQLDPSMPDDITLRVYKAARNEISSVDGALLLERRLRFTPGAPGCGRDSFFFFGCGDSFVHHPGHILIGSLLDTFPELEAAVGARFGIRIELEPTAGLEYWPMVTKTENATNHVTVYTAR